MQKQKLLDLADHIEFGKRGHDKFAFGTWSSREEVLSKISKKKKSKEVPVCKTLGCAIGECPILFPDDWKFEQKIGHSVPVCWGNPGPTSSAMEFFELTRDEVDHLFIPMHQTTWLYKTKTLPWDASPEDVAANIRAFVAAKSVPYKRLYMFVMSKIHHVVELFS